MKAKKPTSKAAKQTTGEVVTISMSSELKAEALKLADSRELSLSAFIRQLILKAADIKV